MGALMWCSRRIGGLSIIALIVFCYWVVQIQRSSPSRGPTEEEVPHRSEATPFSAFSIASDMLVYIVFLYSFLIHVIVVIVPIRAFISIWDITRRIKQIHFKEYPNFTTTLSFNVKNDKNNAPASPVSEVDSVFSNFYDSPKSDYSVEDIELASNDGFQCDELQPTIHAIVLPNYKEDLETLRETLDVLASHPHAKDSYDLYLAMETRESNSDLKAQGLAREYAKRFRNIDYTMHAADVPGEAAGKGSNMGWAVRQLSTKYPIAVRKQVLLTCIDSDSHLLRQYFEQLADMHRQFPDTAQTTLYAAPIIFNRNADQVPMVVRLADIAWSCAGISGLFQGSTISPPTSVYSLPLLLVDRVGGWDCDCEAIGEDLHMFLKCFYALNGHITCRTILSPVSQTNVTSGHNKGGIRDTILGFRARYQQALRHMWGALDAGYSLRKTIEMFKGQKRLARSFCSLHHGVGDDSGYYSPTAQSGDDDIVEYTIDADPCFYFIHTTLKKPDWVRTFHLGVRLFEAHFLPVHIIVVSGFLAMYTLLVGDSDPYKQSWVFPVCHGLRLAGAVFFYVFLAVYEPYHRLCCQIRQREMDAAELSGGMHFSARTWKNLADYAVLPLIAPMFGILPSLHAQFAHFVTVDLAYTVSGKAVREKDSSAASAQEELGKLV